MFSADEIRRRESSARRRSSSATVDGKGRAASSPKPAQRSAEDKQERGRKPSVSAIDGKARLPGSSKPTQRSLEDKQEKSRKFSVSKTSSPRHKPEQPVTPSSRKMSTGSTVHRSLPTTPTERKSSTSQNGVKSNAIKGPKSSPVTEKTKGKQTPPTSRRENKSLIKTKELADTKANKNVEKERKLKHQDEKDKASRNEQIKEGVLNICDISKCEDSVANGQLNENVSENSDGIDDVSSTRDISSPEGRFSPMPTINGGRKTSECSLETDSDVNSDLFSDMTDTDYDFRSQRYSGLSETSSDISFGTSPAWKLFHSVELDKNAPEPESSELGSSLKDCLMNLNLQGSVTPTMKRRIFDAASTRNPKEELPDSAMDSETPPVDKAVFFDIEHYNDKSPNEEDDMVGSPRKWSLVKSLISSIEKRSSSSIATGKATKNAATISRTSAPGTASKHHGMDESAVSSQKTINNHETPRARPLPFNEHSEVQHSQIYIGVGADKFFSVKNHSSFFVNITCVI